MEQFALLDVFLLSTCQGCGLAKSWTVGRRGWGVFLFGSAMGGRGAMSCAQLLVPAVCGGSRWVMMP